MLKEIALAVRELMGHSKPDSHVRDLVAYITLCLRAIDETVERTVLPWEKRGYWVKADRFRMDWKWAILLSDQMEQALKGDEWDAIARLSGQVAEKVRGVNLPKRGRQSSPWEGAWQRLQGK